jgi:hypothetical protein
VEVISGLIQLVFENKRNECSLVREKKKWIKFFSKQALQVISDSYDHAKEASELRIKAQQSLSAGNFSGAVELYSRVIELLPNTDADL